MPVTGRAYTNFPTSSPKYRLRGHQIGYRPKVNTYDAWTPADFEQYVRAVAVPAVPPGVAGFACFRFLNRFTYGNFGDTDGFGLGR